MATSITAPYPAGQTVPLTAGAIESVTVDEHCRSLAIQAEGGTVEVYGGSQTDGGAPTGTPGYVVPDGSAIVLDWGPGWVGRTVHLSTSGTGVSARLLAHGVA